MTTGKKVIIAIALVITLIAIYGYNKGKKLLAIFEKMTIEPSAVHDLKVSSHSIDFRIDLLLKNESPDSFDINSFGIASVKSVDIYYNDIFIAQSIVGITSISIPGNDQLILHDIPVSVPPKLLLTNPTLVYELATNFNMNKITTHALLNIAGVEITI